MNELIKITYDAENPTISGRELHDALEVETPYRIWFPRMCEYGFEEGEDFNPNKNVRVQNEGEREVARDVTDHALTLAMAKELAMLQRNEKGKQVRRYLIAVEEQWNSPDAIMQRALTIANERVKILRAENSELTVQTAIMAPKRNTLTSWLTATFLPTSVKPQSSSAFRPRNLCSSCLMRNTSSGTNAVGSCPTRTRTTVCLRSRNLSTKRPNGAGRRRSSRQRDARRSGCSISKLHKVVPFVPKLCAKIVDVESRPGNRTAFCLPS